jgi:hypothetical protein
MLLHIDLHAAGELPQLGAHDGLKYPEGPASRAVAGQERNLGITGDQAFCQRGEFLFGFKGMHAI